MNRKASCSDLYRDTLPADVRKRYNEKTSVIQVDPYELPDAEFTIDHPKWPLLSYVDMLDFLIFKQSYYTREQLRNVKSLDAQELVQDGWVREILHKEIHGNHLLRAKVTHSRRIREKPLETWVIMASDGSVNSAHCTCMAGLDECCSHVAAMLFILESASRAKQEASVTDVPAYWMFPTAAKLDAPYKRIRDMDFQSAARKRKLSSAESSSTTTTPEYEDVHLLDNIPSPTKNEEAQFLEDLHKAQPTAAILSLTDQFSNEFVPKSQLNEWPLDFTKLYDVSASSLSFEELVKKCEETDISVTQKQIDFLEQQTRKQSSSAFWFKYRTGRITASNFYAVCHTTTSNPSVTLVKKLCSSENYSRAFTSAATEWGKRKEEIARKAFFHSMSRTHTNFSINECGLVLNEKYPEFGASPDGLTACDCCGTGSLEIKCPYSAKDKLSLDVSWLEKTDNAVKLKQKHPYYYQIQMQLFITERQFCDFFVWTPNVSHLERIMCDEGLWNVMSEKAKDFHRLCIMPELVGKYYSRQQVLKPVLHGKSDSTAVVCDNGAPTSVTVKYCVCGGEDDGRRMIFCESENCEKQWFHMECLKLKRAPKGKWICKGCRK